MEPKEPLPLSAFCCQNERCVDTLRRSATWKSWRCRLIWEAAVWVRCEIHVLNLKSA